MPRKAQPQFTVTNRYANGVVRTYVYGQRPDYPPVKLPPDLEEEFCKAAIDAILSVRQKEVKAG